MNKENNRGKKLVLILMIFVVIALTIPLYAFIFSKSNECTSNPFVWGAKTYNIKECVCRDYYDQKYAFNKTTYWEINENNPNFPIFTVDIKFVNSS